MNFDWAYLEEDRFPAFLYRANYMKHISNVGPFRESDIWEIKFNWNNRVRRLYRKDFMNLPE